MNRLDEAQRAVNDAALRIRALIEDALAAGDFEEVASLAQLAQAPFATDGASPRAVDLPPRSAGIEGQGRGEREDEPQPAGEGQRRAQFPRFVREGDVLVKVGWSQSQNSTYEHRAGKEVLDLVVSRVSELGSGGQRFTAEALKNYGGTAREESIPGYQMYLCLAWLKHLRLIGQHGRRWYSVREPENLLSDVAQRWSEVPERD